MAKKNRSAMLETQDVAEQQEDAPQEELIDFTSWFALRKSKIPVIHKKEILEADFNARKVPKLATIEEFDNALSKYGVQLI